MLRTIITVGEARKIVGSAAGRVEQKQQLKLMNQVRQLIYAQQDDLGIDLSMPFFACIECFTDTAGKSRYGFRLPQNFHSVKALDIDGVPPILSDNYRTPYDGIAVPGSPLNVRAYATCDFPLERDLLESGPISFVSSGNEAENMVVYGQTVEAREEKVEYDVTYDRGTSNQVWRALTRVRFKKPTKSVVRIFAGDRELARYAPGSVIPQFREYLLDGVCSGQSVIVRANRQFSNLIDDDDLVEFGEDLIWENLADYINLLRKKDKDENDRANLNLYLGSAVDQMRSSSRVDDGQAMAFVFRRKKIKGGNLS